MQLTLNITPSTVPQTIQVNIPHVHSDSCQGEHDHVPSVTSQMKNLNTQVYPIPEDLQHFAIPKEAGETNDYYPVPEDLDLKATPWSLPPQEDLVFVNANIVDTATMTILKSRTLRTKGGKIASIAPTSALDLKESGAVDCSGLFLSPGLMDMHTHVSAVPGGDGSGLHSSGIVDTVLKSTYVIKGMLSRGYTTIRDVGGATKAHADATENWLIPGPRIFQGGPVFSQTGGHGDSSDPQAASHSCCAGGGGGGLGMVVDGVADCLKATRKAMMQGANHIKVCTSGGIGSVTDALEGTQFTVEELQAISKTVKFMGGTITTAHCYTSAGIRHAIEGGVRGIEHGNLLDEPTAKLMAEHDMYLTPTLNVHFILAGMPFKNILLPSQQEKNAMVRDKGLEAIQHAEKAGVTVCLGSDMTGMMGRFQTGELVRRASVLPSATVLKQATINPAKLVGQPNLLGQLREGFYADILILTSNPIEDVTIFDRPKENLLAIVKDGRCVKSSVKGLEVEVSLGRDYFM